MLPPSDVATPSRAGRREWIGLAVLALPCVLYSMDLTVLNLAVPSLTKDLKPSSSELLWIVDIYGFLLSGSLITMGTLGDRIGRRRLLMIGATAFGICSVLTALSSGPELLIAARALLGISAAMLAPSTLSLIRNMFLDPRQRTIAIGVWISSFSAGAAIGPLLGGALLERFWWGSVFLLGVPVMVLLLAVGPRLLPEFRDPYAGKVDLISAAVSLVAVLAVIYGLKQVAAGGPGRLPALSIIFGLVAGVVFLCRQRTLAGPLIDLRLFRSGVFSASLATNTLAFFVAFAAFLYLAQYLQLVLGLSPLRAGLWTLPSSGAFIIGSSLTPVITRWLRPAFVMGAGLVLAAIGFGVLTQLEVAEALAVLVVGSVAFSLGLAPVFTLSTDLVVGAAPPERAGAASGIAETSSEFGGALGIAILGSVATAVYRTEVTDAVPAGVPSGAAAAARDTLGGAIDVAAELPLQLAPSLVAAAREAFTSGLRVGAAISAIVAVGLAVFVTTMLRNVRSSQYSEQESRDGSDAPVACTARDDM